MRLDGGTGLVLHNTRSHCKTVGGAGGNPGLGPRFTWPEGPKEKNERNGAVHPLSAARSSPTRPLLHPDDDLVQECRGGQPSATASEPALSLRPSIPDGHAVAAPCVPNTPVN